jgi:hypothetical protein
MSTEHDAFRDKAIEDGRLEQFEGFEIEWFPEMAKGYGDAYSITIEDEGLDLELMSSDFRRARLRAMALEIAREYASFATARQ